MNDVYTRESFAASFSLRGYGKKKAALEWLESNGIESPVEADFERCWRDLEYSVIRPHRSPYTALFTDGQNPVDPAHIPNSYGESFAAMMRRATKELDALERAYRKASNQKEAMP